MSSRNSRSTPCGVCCCSLLKCYSEHARWVLHCLVAFIDPACAAFSVSKNGKTLYCVRTLFFLLLTCSWLAQSHSGTARFSTLWTPTRSSRWTSLPTRPSRPRPLWSIRTRCALATALAGVTACPQSTEKSVRAHARLFVACSPF